MSERRHDLIALSILLIVPTILFIDVLVGTRVFYLRDVATYYHPAKSILRDIVLGGEFPYWNPWFSAGQPMAANPEHEVFYPLTWLILLPGYNFAFHLLAVIHIHIATFAMYALLRSMRLGRPASVFGGLSFGLGGVSISLLNLWPCLFSFAWLPLTALYTRAFLRTGSRRALAAAAFFLGVQLVIGEPVTAFITGIVLGMYAISHGWRAGGPLRALRMVAAVALISTLALLVSAVQTLPAVDHFGDSVRSRGLEWQLVRSWSMPLIRLGELVFPHFLGFGIPDQGGPFWGAHLYADKGQAFMYSIYGGLAIAAFAITGVAARIRGAILFLGISAVSLLLAAGDNTPLLGFLYDSGIAKTWRYPEKFTMMLGFASVVFAAVVLDRILKGDERLRRIAVRVACVLAGVAVLAAVLSHLPLHDRLFSAVFQTPGPPSNRLLTTSARTWTIEVFRTAAFALILAGAGRMRRNVWLAAFAVFMVVDIGPLVFELAPREHPSFYDPPAITAEFDPDPEDTRLIPYAQWEGAGRKADAYTRTDESLFWIVRNGLTPMMPAEYGIRTIFEIDFDLTALLPTVDFSWSMVELIRRGSSDWLNIALSMSNGEYVSLFEKPEIAYAKAGGNLFDLQPVKLVRGTAYPRYYFASELVSIRDRSEFVELLLKSRYPRDVAFIAAPAFQPAPGRVHAWRETANTASLDVEAAGRAFLVMSVTPHKYWQVAIDGTEVEPLVTNIGYQGIVIPPGRHTVTMRYHNPLIAAGGAITLAALLALLFIARSGSHAMSSAREANDAAEPTHA